MASRLGEICGPDISAIADGAVVAHRFVKRSTSVAGAVTAITSAGEAADGVAWDDAADTEPLRLVNFGQHLVESGGVITAGAALAVTANGRVAVATAGQIVVAKACEAAGGAGEFIHCHVFAGPAPVSGSNALLIATENGKVVAIGDFTPATDGEDDVPTGLALVEHCLVSFKGLPTLTHMFSYAGIGDQAGAPAAGSIRINHLKPTSNANVTLVAATTPWSALTWIAYGTL